MDKAPDAFRTISEVADDLDVPQHVLRFWETRFSQIKPMKRGGGRRYYRPDDVDLLRGIRHLLYGEGYTIRGVQRILKENGIRFVQSVWQDGAAQPMRQSPEDEDQDEAAAAKNESERRGGRFGPLPTLQGDDAEGDDAEGDDAEGDDAEGDDAEDDDAESDDANIERREPPLAAMPRVQPSATAPPAMPLSRATPTAGLPRDDLRKLKAALQELGECRKLLDAAVGESA